MYLNSLYPAYEQLTRKYACHMNVISLECKMCVFVEGLCHPVYPLCVHVFMLLKRKELTLIIWQQFCLKKKYMHNCNLIYRMLTNWWWRPFQHNCMSGLQKWNVSYNCIMISLFFSTLFVSSLLFVFVLSCLVFSSPLFSSEFCMYTSSPMKTVTVDTAHR